MNWEIRQGSALELLRELPDAAVQTCITSPPYYGLRDYGTAEWEGGEEACDHAPRMGTSATSGLDGGEPVGSPRDKPLVTCPCGARRIDNQIGLEATPDEYVARLVGVFREVRRVLRDDGTLWLNLGDSYATQPKGNPGALSGGLTNNGRNAAKANAHRSGGVDTSRLPGVKPKDLLGIPWMVAFALRADGWYLRSDIIWAKPNPMPESVRDRPTSAHEHVFLLAKSQRYYYDAEAIREGDSGRPSGNGFVRPERISRGGEGQDEQWRPGRGRNRRNVWTVATRPFPGAHFAVFPPALVEPCVLAGSSSQACAECGAPWERETERVDRGWDGSRYGERAVDATGGAVSGGTVRSTLGSSGGKLTGETRTTGWRPTCEHGPGIVAESLVLDPFAGAGTAGIVALQHGRRFLGLELNPEYVELARGRIERECGLLAAPEGGVL